MATIAGEYALGYALPYALTALVVGTTTFYAAKRRFQQAPPVQATAASIEQIRAITLSAVEDAFTTLPDRAETVIQQVTAKLNALQDRFDNVEKTGNTLSSRVDRLIRFLTQNTQSVTSKDPKTWAQFGSYYKDATINFFNPLSVVKTMYNTGPSYLGVPAVAKAGAHAYVAYGAIPKYIMQGAKYCASFVVDPEPATEQFCSIPYTAVWCTSPAEAGVAVTAKAAEYGTWALAKGLETTGKAASVEIGRQVTQGFDNLRDDMKDYVGKAVKNATNSLFNPSSFFSSQSTETPEPQTTFNYEDGVPLGSSSAGARSGIPHNTPKGASSSSNQGSDLIPVAMLVGAAALTYIIGSQISKFLNKTTELPSKEK